MPIYLVWDESCDEETAHSYSDSSAADAAETFADDDVDGHMDGVYERGHTVYVKDELGLVRTFEVTVEYNPTFHASEVTTKPDGKVVP